MVWRAPGLFAANCGTPSSIIQRTNPLNATDFPKHPLQTQKESSDKDHPRKKPRSQQNFTSNATSHHGPNHLNPDPPSPLRLFNPNITDPKPRGAKTTISNLRRPDPRRRRRKDLFRVVRLERSAQERRETYLQPMGAG
ncbi:hypothetical protein AC579_7281 [Pseudocercospora musae]|uniref:Uncharacterized protein n=1 Tax=Pseudocercospora musae TaxID=113226 RepID=A0A139GVP2_9PEZI|nr:hypothetical protein AC579_7281 [Pseudocercospora musae]